MKSNHDLTLQNLDEAVFSQFGKASLVKHQQAPNSSGEGWECWYPYGEIKRDRNLYFGIVKAEPRQWMVGAMERHQDRKEWIFALDKPIIQVVALSDPAVPDHPDSTRTIAFRIDPGQGVMVNRGIWHAAGLSFSDGPTHYLFILGKQTKKFAGQDTGWIEFSDHAS